MFEILILLGILLAVGFSGFFSGIETAAYSVNTIDLHAKVAHGNKRAILVTKLLSNMPSLITTMLIGTNLSIFVATNLLTNYFTQLSFSKPELFTTLILTPFCFLFAESLPKRIAFEIPNICLIISARFIFICKVLFYPVSITLGGVGTILQYVLDKKGHADNEIIGKVRLYESLEARTAEGGISLEQYRMASRVMDHEKTLVSEFTLNPIETFTVPDSATCREAGRLIRENGYARALICNRFMRFTGEIVTINSIMNLDGMLDKSVTNASEKALLLDRRTPILHAISKMRDHGARIAIVKSRNGVFIGSVQLNTLLDSIVRGLSNIN